MQLRAHIRDFIPPGTIFIMVLLSVTITFIKVYANVPVPGYTLIIPDTTILKDTVIGLDSLSVISGDTVLPDTIPGQTHADSIKPSKPAFKDIITFSANDSATILVRDKKMFLDRNASVKYIKTQLEAGHIEMDMQQNLAHASGITDSAGVVTEKPKFKDGSQEFDCSSLSYNFKTGKGYVKNIITQEGDGYIQGELTKKMSDSVYCVKNGWYTTCDEHDHPHFLVKMSRAKMIRGKKVISGFTYLEIEQVPLPLFIPFGFFPITKKGTSGIIMPTYGEEQMRGFNLHDGGYYWAISQYIDLAITGSIYTNGSWALNAMSNYRKRYRFNGGFNFSTSKNYYSEKGLPDYSVSNDWAVRWTHSQDAKANPYSTFSASVDISSANNNYYNATNMQDIANQRKQSSVSWSKKWPENPFSITAALSHNQNSVDTTISLTLPNINIRMSQIYPLRKKERVGQLKWYENIGFSYTAELRNNIQTKEYNLGESFKHMDKEWQNGFKHNIPLSTSINLMKDVSLSPSFNYTGVAYLNSIDKIWVDTSATGGYVKTDTIPGFRYAHNYSASVSLSYNPTIYGMYTSQKLGSKIYALRHVIRPSISASYTPEIGVPKSKYTKTYTDNNGVVHEYSIFEGKAFGVPGSAQESGSVSLSLDNNIEMKVRNDKDTTGKEEFTKIKLLESLRASTSYNIFADSMNWSNIQLSARTKIFKDRVNINVSGTLDPYAIDANARRYNKYNGGIGRLTNVSASSSIQFSSSKGEKRKEKKLEEIGEHYYEYMDFDVPWNISIDYSLSYSKSYSPNTSPSATKPITKSNISQIVNINGDLSLTQKWKIGYSTGYDIKNNEITATSFNISRDLHCWEMTFSCIPFGNHQSYNFKINVRSSLLKDLKLTKRDSWYGKQSAF